jgi:GSCFA family
MNVKNHPNKYWRYSIDRQSKLSQISEFTQHRLITKNSVITSLGSCFADHIRIFLKDQGYNYIITEPNQSGASANWGRIYNPISMCQIIDYCQNAEWNPQERWWSNQLGQIIDPYREISPYANIHAAEEDFERHRLLARKVLTSADVVILTYGLVEVWRSAIDKFVFQSRPIAFEPAKHCFSVLEYEECFQAMQTACQNIHSINPQVTIILTVSPVPLRATFRPDVTPVTANLYSKSVLLAAVQSISQQLTNVCYFPSYEIVMECVENPFSDKGTVKSATIDLVMSLFEKQFVNK